MDKKKDFHTKIKGEKKMGKGKAEESYCVEFEHMV